MSLVGDDIHECSGFCEVAETELADDQTFFPLSGVLLQ